MDDLFALFGSDDDVDVEGGPVGYGHGGGIDMGGEDRDEGQEQDDDIGLDLPESRPVKRSRSGPAVSPSSPGAAAAAAAGFGAGDDSGSGNLLGGGRGGSGAIDEQEEKEVIEILSDDDDAQPLSRRSRHSGIRFVDRDEAQDGGTAFRAARGGGASTKLSNMNSNSSHRNQRGGLKGYHAPATSVCKRELGAMATGGGGARAQKPAAAPAAAAAAAAGGADDDDASAGVVPPFKSVGGGGRAEEDEGKPSAEEKEAAAATAAAAGAATGQAAGGSGWLGGLMAAAKAATSKISSRDDDPDSHSASGDFPLNLECAMCFNPLAVSALFACGHGSCWQCAHDWCSRDTSATMDCPTCHVSVPRNDFRRCVVLDEVVDRAVVAAGMDDDEWRARLERGQKLAREAEARRRDSRDAQRTAEETIAKQAAELKRLKEEAKEARSRGGGGRRSWRSYEQQGLPPSMADYGFRLMSSGGRDLLDPASHRSAIEEFTRFRHRRAEETAGGPGGGGDEQAPPSRSARSAGDAAAVAAAAFGVPPSSAGTYGGLRQRGSTQSGFGISEGDPWFSLRPSQSSRQPGMAMSGGRMVMSGGRMVRTDSLGRSAGNSAAAAVGLEQQAAGAALKSAHERTSGGSNWRSAYLNAGRLSLSGGEGGRTGSRATADTRGGGHGVGGAPFGRAGPPAGAGRDPAAHTSPSLFGNPRSGLRGGLHAAAGASSPYPAGGGVGLAPPPGSQYDANSFGGPSSRREQPSRSRGGRGGGGQYAGHGGRNPAAPTLDLDELIMSGQDDNSSRSEWDDVLASVSMPPRPERLGRSESPDASQG